MLSDDIYLDDLRGFLVSRGALVTTDVDRGELTIYSRTKSIEALRRDVEAWLIVNSNVAGRFL